MGSQHQRGCTPGFRLKKLMFSTRGHQHPERNALSHFVPTFPSRRSLSSSKIRSARITGIPLGFPLLTLMIIMLADLLHYPAHAHLGSCEDHHLQCPYMRNLGYCESHLQYMAENCPVSCDICLDNNCYDRLWYCSEWARRGHCYWSRGYMRKYCPHTCDLCDIPLGDF